ncbi:hypothetical protein [Ideonella sp. YS5]|uniref:hypothetical protein n=1 Tax=Ideonella sp. YS5 TaxID=3453714 RepID=UPI003EED8B94
MRTMIAAVLAAVTLALSGCGGGGGGSDETAQGCTPTMADPDACAPKLQLVLTDAAGAETTQVSPDSAGVLRAVLKHGDGAPIPNVVVTFTSTDKGGAFVPASGTALTGADGVAQVGLPAGPLAGAFTVSASASVEGRALSSPVNYAVTFPVLTFSPIEISPSPLSAGGSASVSVTVMKGDAPYTTPLSVSFTSSCVNVGKATLDAQVTTRNGVATASYADMACAAVDTITASVTLGGATVTRSGDLTVMSASAGSIKFVGTDTPNIALKGTGGVGRQEFAVLTFQAFDDTGHPAVGKGVDFEFSYPSHAEDVFGLKLGPTHATTDADGKVTTTVFAGTIPTSVRVKPSISDSPDITTLSNLLVVSTGVPDQMHFSLSTETGNCEGWNFDQLCSRVKVVMGDHFGNPVPDGTAVSFTAEGGVIDPSCVTTTGTCTVELHSSNPRPAGARVTVLAFALGEEDFFDADGDNVYDAAGDSYTEKSPDIFRDDNENAAWTAGEPCVGPNASGDCATPGNGQYDGVLGIPDPNKRQTLYVSSQLVQIFSASEADIRFSPAHLSCSGDTADFQVTVKDVNGNLMPAGTTISFTALFGIYSAPVVPNNIAVPNVVLAMGEPMLIPTYTATVGCAGGSGTLTATVTTPNKVVTYASIPIN